MMPNVTGHAAGEATGNALTPVLTKDSTGILNLIHDGEIDHAGSNL